MTVQRRPSPRARAAIRRAAAIESSTAAPWLRWLNDSVTPNAKRTSSSPVGEQPLVPALVQREPGADDARAGPTAATTSSAPAICGTRRRVDEARYLDRREAGVDEPSDELGAHRDVEDLRLVLQPVARPDVVDGDARGHSHASEPR